MFFSFSCRISMTMFRKRKQLAYAMLKVCNDMGISELFLKLITSILYAVDARVVPSAYEIQNKLRCGLHCQNRGQETGTTTSSSSFEFDIFTQYKA